MANLISPQAMSALQAGGFDTPQMQQMVFEQGGTPFRTLQAMELEAAQMGDRDRLARIQQIMAARRGPPLISGQSMDNNAIRPDRGRTEQEQLSGFDAFNPFEQVSQRALSR